MPHKKSGLSVNNPEYWELKKKHSFMGDLLKGTYERFWGKWVKERKRHIRKRLIL